MKKIPAIKTGILFAAISTLSATTMSASAEETSGITFSPMVGKIFFSDDRNLNDEGFLSLSLGYEFNPTWATELTYLTSEPSIQNTNIELDLTQYRLDALYHFNDEKVRPYLVAGLGETKVELNSFDDKETLANLGAGVKYAVNDVLSLRGDVRLSHGFDSDETDVLAAVGLHFLFGKNNKTSSTPAKKVQATAPEKTLDKDNDGIADSMDKCPSTPAKQAVDQFGCALKPVDNDLDKDGIANSQDKCPDTKAGAKVDATGCYVVLTENVSVNLHINFGNNSAEVVSDAYDEVKRVANFMREYPQAKVVIEGHTDDRGAAEYNRSLSQKRANAVAQILIQEFSVNPSRVSSVGFGEAKPLFDNSTAENRAKNRRVVAVVNATVTKTEK